MKPTRWLITQTLYHLWMVLLFGTESDRREWMNLLCASYEASHIKKEIALRHARQERKA